MKSLTLLLMGLFLLSSCKGTRFYWETQLIVDKLSDVQKKALKKKFNITTDLANWHPVYGKYCTGLNSNISHLFVCWKGSKMRIISSYPGTLKGDSPVRDQPATVGKYTSRITETPGYRIHRNIEEYALKNFRVRGKLERVLMYGRGSLIIKDELSSED